MGAERRVFLEARRMASRVRGERNAHIFAQCPPPPKKNAPQDCAPRPRRHCSRPEIYFTGSFIFLACWLFPMRGLPRSCKGNPREKYVSAEEGTCSHALFLHLSWRPRVERRALTRSKRGHYDTMTARQSTASEASEVRFQISAA